MTLQENVQHQKLFRNIGLAGLYLGMIGLSTSPIALTFSPILILIGAFGSLPFKEQWSRFWNNKPAVLIAGIFLFQLVSGLYSENIPSWLEEVKIKIPLPVILYGLSVLGPFNIRERKISIGLLILSTFVTGTLTLIHYLLNRVEIDQMIASSKPMEITFGIPHIYYSMVMAFTVVAGYWFYRKQEIAVHRGEKWIVGLAALANFIFLHILTTRTGLVACYLAILALGIIIFIQRRQYARVLIMISLLTIIPVAGYFTVPSLRARVDNTWWDVSNYWKGGDPNYLSIATRMESWRIAGHLIRDNLWLGVGTADLHEAMMQEYDDVKSPLCLENQVEPHNMFITYFAGYGIPGGLYFLIAWFFPLFLRRKRSLFLFLAFWFISTFSMMGEATLERQVGVMFLALCWNISLTEDDSEIEKG